MADGQQGGQDVQEIIRILKNKGMKSSDLIQLFGPMLGVGGAGNNYDQLFAQYMPTFMQINQSEPENSLRRSIAAEVMAGTPIWQIEEGISNAITAGDPGVSPSARYEDYVGLAKTLTNEYQNYSTKAEKDNVFTKYNIPRPEERYTIEQFFPDAMAQLAKIEKDNPSYTLGAVGSGAVLPERMTGTKSTISASGTDATALLKMANDALNNAQNFQFKGTTYDPVGIRDVVIPQLKAEEKQQKDEIKNIKKLQERYEKQQRNNISKADIAYKNAQFVTRNNIDYARSLFDSGAISGEEYKNIVNTNKKQAETTTALLKKLQTQKAPDDLYSLLKAIEGPDYKPTGPNYSIPSPASSKYSSITGGPNGYVGPAAGESTMARTYDPYSMQIRRSVIPALQEKLDKSGRTPQMDALFRLAQSGLLD